MNLTIRLLASYRKYLPEDHDERAGFACEVTEGTRVYEVLATLELPRGDPYTILVNGLHASKRQVLREGDTLAVFPAVGGG